MPGVQTMIFSYLIFLVAGVAIFFLMGKLGLPIRIAVALAVFLIPSIMLTVWVARTGDKAPPDAITITPKPPSTPNETNETDSKD